MIIYITLASKPKVYQATFNNHVKFKGGETINSYKRKHDLKVKRFIYKATFTENQIFEVFDQNDCNTWTSKFVNIIAVIDPELNRSAIYFFEIDYSILESLG